MVGERVIASVPENERDRSDGGVADNIVLSLSVKKKRGTMAPVWYPDKTYETAHRMRRLVGG